MSARKKVILVYPRFLIQEGPKFNVPLSVLHLGSYIQSKGYEVKIVDGNIEDNYEQLIAEEAKRSLCVGFSAMTDQISEARRVARFLKKKAGLKVPIVFGGVHATLFPEQTVVDPLIDFAVYGEGELSFWHLLEALRGERSQDRLRGTAFLNRKGKFFFKPRTQQFNFQKMPFIDYSLLSPFVQKQFEENFISMQTSRGCPYQCTFCINAVIEENTLWRAWSPERVIKEIKNLKKSWGVSKLFFWDENFFVNKKRVEGILTKLEKENIKINWYAEARADYFHQNFLGQFLLKRIRKNGCLRFGIGAESGSQHMLDVYNKRTTPAQILKSAKLCCQSDINPTYSFMIGAPGETKTDIRKTVKLIGKIFKVCPTTRILGPQLFRPYPGSVLYQECLKSGWKEPKSLKDWGRVVSKEFMQTNPFKSPWIRNPKFVNIIWFYSFLLVLPIKKLIELFWEYSKIYKKNLVFSILGMAGIVIISSIGKLRYKFNFYDLPFEVKLFKKSRSILSS